MAFLIGVLVCHAGLSAAQSLAEVARREKQRRKNLQDRAEITVVDPSRTARSTDSTETRTARTPAPRPQKEPETTAPAVVRVTPEPVVRIAPSRVAPEPVREPTPTVTRAPAPNREGSLAEGYRLMAAARHREAADQFRTVLSVNPNDREARLGLARVYTRSGNHSTGRAEFEKLLELNASDADAMVGIAQSYQWSGVGPMAREWYERALAIDPRHEEAEVGIGYIELWNESAVAEDRSERLLDRYPTSGNVRALQAEAKKNRAPQAQVSIDRLTDSHDNELETAWVQTSLGLSSGWDMWLGGAFYDMRFDGDELVGAPGSGSVTSVYGAFGRPIAPGQRIDFRAGVDYRKDTTGVTDYVPIGGAAWSWGLDRRWSGRVSFDRDSFRYTTRAIDDGIVLNAFAASVSNRLAANWILDGELGYWDIEDNLGIDSSRFSAEGGIRYRRLFRRKIPFEAGYDFQYFTYKESFGAAFFSPSFYRGHRLNVGIAGPIGSVFTYDVRGSTGVQSFDFVSHEPLWTASGTFGVRLGSDYRLEVFGIRGDYLMLSNFPVTSEQYGVRVRWHGGSTR